MGNVLPAISIIGIFLSVASLLFAAWPLVLLAPLKYRENGIGSLLAMWAILSILRLALIFRHDQIMDIQFIPEPARTIAFLITGGILWMLFVLRFLRRA